MVHLLQSTIVSNSFYCVECIHHTLAILPTNHNFWLMFANQLWADHFGHGWLQNSSTRFIKSCELAVRTSNITKLRTCSCGLQELQSCGLALRIQESWNVVADLRLLTKLLNVQLWTCGCGLRKLKFSCGFEDCGLKKNLQCSALLICAMFFCIFN